MILRILFLLLLALPLHAAQTVVFANGSFETQVLGEGGYTSANTTSWTSNGSAGAFNPDTPLNFAPDGANVIFFDGGGFIAQNLKFAGNVAMTAQPGSTLTVNFSARGRFAGLGSLRLTLKTTGGATVAGPVVVSVPVNATGYSALSGSLLLPGASVLGANNGQPVNLLIEHASGAQMLADNFTGSYAMLPSIASFTASPSVITTAGGSSTLSWTVSGATALTLNGSAISGTSMVVTPTGTTNYTLVATSADGTVSASTVVAVSATNNLRISEFMAANVSSLADGNGAFSDWVEIENPTGASISTTGYFLTDDRANLAKWPFQARTITAGGRLLVFCSGQLTTNYADPAGNPHTNFRLADGGEYLALVGPGGIVSEFHPSYAAQFPNISYGRGTVPSRVAESLVGSGAPVKYIVPAAETPGWQANGFADGAWTSVTQSVGFDQNFGPLTTAATLPANSIGDQNFGGSLGMDFDVTAPVQVTQLAAFDAGGNGITGSIIVQLWSRNNGGTSTNPSDDTAGSVLASATFTGSTDTLDAAYRFKNITSITLGAGSYTIVAYGYNASELLYNRSPYPTTNTGGALNFVGSGRYGTAGAWPATPDAGPAARYGAGSLVFRTLPGTTTTSDISAAMFNVNPGAFIRVPFSVASPAFAAMTLTMTYDDGFVAYLNGTEIARRNAPATPLYNSAATGSVSVPNFTETIDVSPHAGLLQNGANVLAIHGLNATAGDVDFKIDARLTGERAATSLAYFTTPTPGAASGSGVLYPRVVISEIHSDPTDSNTYPTEFIELYNPSSSAVDASGWAFTKGVAFTFPNGTSIPARGYLVVAENPATLLSRLGAVGIGPWVGSLKNDGETIELVDALGTVVDTVAYGLSFPWPVVGSGSSMQLLNEGLDNQLGGAWRAATPTPGAANIGATVNVPPIVRQVAHTFTASLTPTSVVPSNAPVTITAKVTDLDGVFTAAVEYQIVAPGSFIRVTDAAFATSWTSIAMTPTTANDGTFSAVIPGSVQQHRRLIRYRIVATDQLGQSATFPVATDPCPNFAYFCYDGVPAWTAAVQPGVTSATTFSEATMRKVRPWHLLSQAADVQACQYNSAFNDGVYRFYGALVVDGVVYDHVRYRIKGQGSTYNTGKNKWKFKFNPGQLLEMPDDYGTNKTTIETLNISSVPSPWAPWNRGLAGLDEVMQFRLSQLAGVPAPNTSYLQWRVIDDAAEAPASQFEGDLFGIYAAFENQDNHFKDEHGLPDGNIFRMQSGGNHLLGQGAGQPDNLSDLNSFLSTTTGYNKGAAGSVGTYQNEAWFRANVDMPRYYSWRTVVEAVNGTDIRDQENVVYFRDPLTGKWHIQPWDCDLLYEQFDRWGPKGTQNASPYEQIRRGLAHTALRIEFQNRARELQDLLINSDQAWKLIDEYVSLITDEPPSIIPNGGAIAAGFIEADRRRWDYWPLNPVQPRSNGNNFGQFYLTPYNIGSMGSGPIAPFNVRSLASADFTGMVKWVKDFIVTDVSGGARLTEFTLNQRDLYTLNTTGTTQQIPNTPTLTDLSASPHPINALTFQTTAFSSPNAQTFSAMQWRIAEVRWPGLTGHLNGKPWRYEIEDTWTSTELPVFNNQFTFPAQSFEAGVTYRVRIKMKDSAGHWSHWSAPVEFVSGPPDVTFYQQNLVVSEIMYKPNGGSDYEFLELRNLSTTTTLDLTPVTFSGGVDYSFPQGTMLAPGATVIVPKKLTTFQARYGNALPTVTEWGTSDSLNNSGDTLTLNFGQNAVIRTFTYQASAPWPNLTALTGHSIVLKLPTGTTTAPDHSIGANWRASSAANGNPGASDALYFTGNLTADVDFDGLNALLEYALATSDTNTAQGLSAYSLTLDSTVPGTYRFTYQRPLAVDDVTYTLQSSVDLTPAWTFANAQFITRTAPVAGIVTETYRVTPPVGATRFFVRLQIVK